MQAGLVGLGVWSFLMATAHGAGLMLWPVLMPLCFPAGGAGIDRPLPTALLGIAVHTAGDADRDHGGCGRGLRWVGLEILRRAWINVDLIWTWRWSQPAACC